MAEPCSSTAVGVWLGLQTSSISASVAAKTTGEEAVAEESAGEAALPGEELADKEGPAGGGLFCDSGRSRGRWKAPSKTPLTMA